MVMAGCLPSYAPVVRAALLALTDPEFNLNGVRVSPRPFGTKGLDHGATMRRLAPLPPPCFLRANVSMSAPLSCTGRKPRRGTARPPGPRGPSRTCRRCGPGWRGGRRCCYCGSGARPPPRRRRVAPLGLLRSFDLTDRRRRGASFEASDLRAFREEALILSTNAVMSGRLFVEPALCPVPPGQSSAAASRAARAVPEQCGQIFAVGHRRTH